MRCIKCNKRLKKSRIKRRFCSNSCSAKYRATGKFKEEANRWKGGTFIRKDTGYVMMYIGNGKYQYKHRLVMEKYLGRKLKKSEYIHHKNGVKTDNRIENLQILVAEKHHGEICCPKCDYKFLIK